MSRGFAAAGATPVRGESAASTLSRELLSPVASDIMPIASDLLKQRRAVESAKRQDERQIKLAALQNVQRRQQQDFETKARVETAAKQAALQQQKVTETLSNDYTVDGESVPVIVRKDSTGKIIGIFDSSGQESIDYSRLKIWRKPPASVKPITSWLKDVQVKPVGSSDDQFRDAPGALRIADATGENSRVVLNNQTLDFDPNSPNYNARIVEKGSDESAFYSPKSRSVYLNKSATDLFGLDSSLVGQKAIFREYLVRPERRGPNSQSLKELSIAGKTYVFNEHPGYDPKTGNITIERGQYEAPVTYLAADLFREEDPKAFTGAGQITVPSDPKLLAKINSITGLGGVRAGDKLDIERNEQGQTQVRRGQAVIALTDDQNALFQTQPLSSVQKVQAGQDVEPRQLYVNTSDRSFTVGGQTIGPGQTGAFSKTDINTDAFLNVSGSFREVGPVSTDTVTYMLTGPKEKTVDGVQYAPGDEMRISPQAFNNLSADDKKSFTDDRELRSAQVKKNYFKSVWVDVTKREGLQPRKITEQDLQTLLAMFPAGMRSGGKNLRDEVFSMIKYGANANQGAGTTPSAAAASNDAESYAASVQRQLQDARERYDEFVRKGALADVPWETLSFERQRAFADLPKTVQLTKVAEAWQKSEDRLAKDKKAVAPVKPEDAAAFSSAIELLILARQLRDGQEIDNTGRFFGFTGSLGANVFADITPLTSGGSQRLQQIINRMKASYATLSEVEGGGRDSVFRQKLQAELIPSFTKPEKLNRDNLNSMINRLETNIRSTFNKEIQTSNVVPKTFEIMAKDAGITGVSVNQKRYRWLNPNFQEAPPVTRQRVMDGINMVPFEITDAQGLRTGRLLPPIPGAPGRRYVKIKTLDNGEVVIQEAQADGRPDPAAPKLILGSDMRTRVQ